MSTVIRFECRSDAHLVTHPRPDAGRIVMHHGTFGYCGGATSDGEHRWVATGAVFLEDLIRAGVDDRIADARYVPNASGDTGPLHASR
jgi:hypothetical protein